MIGAGPVPHASTESPRKPSLKAPCLRGLGEVGGANTPTDKSQPSHDSDRRPVPDERRHETLKTYAYRSDKGFLPCDEARW